MDKVAWRSWLKLYAAVTGVLLAFVVVATILSPHRFIDRDRGCTYYAIEAVPDGRGLLLYLQCREVVVSLYTPLGPIGPAWTRRSVATYYVPAGVWSGVAWPDEMKQARDGVRDESLLYAESGDKAAILDFVAKWPDVQDYIGSLRREAEDLVALRREAEDLVALRP